MHSRDTTVLIDLLWFNVVHYSSWFQYLFSIYYIVPTPVENSYLFSVLVYCDLISCTTPLRYCPYSSWKFLIFSVLVVYRLSWNSWWLDILMLMSIIVLAVCPGIYKKTQLLQWKVTTIYMHFIIYVCSILTCSVHYITLLMCMIFQLDLIAVTKVSNSSVL